MVWKGFWKAKFQRLKTKIPMHVLHLCELTSINAFLRQGKRHAECELAHKRDYSSFLDSKQKSWGMQANKRPPILKKWMYLLMHVLHLCELTRISAFLRQGKRPAEYELAHKRKCSSFLVSKQKSWGMQANKRPPILKKMNVPTHT